MVTLALTGIAPETVAPEAGAVIVTIRLPSGRAAGRDDIEITPQTTSMATALARLTRRARALRYMIATLSCGRICGAMPLCVERKSEGRLRVGDGRSGEFLDGYGRADAGRRDNLELVHQ